MLLSTPRTSRGSHKEHHMSYIPAHMHAVTPYLSVEGAEDFIAFLTAAFGASLLTSTAGDDGKLKHAELSLLGCTIELSDAKPRWPATRIGLHLFVPDVDAVYTAALAAGAASTYEPTDHAYGERSGGVKDRWGNDWFIASLIDAASRV